VARRATVIAEKRAAGFPLLLVDTGNFVRGKSSANILKAQYMTEAMAWMEYDVINLGREEIVLGHEQLMELRDRERLPLISSNLTWKEGQRYVVKPSLIRRVGGSQFLGFNYGGVKVGMLGLAMGGKNDPMQRLVPREMQIIEPLAALSSSIEKLRKNCDIVMVLSELSLDDAKKMAAEVPGIDLFLFGSGAKSKHIEEFNGTIFTRPAKNGEELGDLELRLDENKKVVSHEVEWTLLDEKVPDTPEMAQLIEQYKTEQKELRNVRPKFQKQ
jgi:2',3'-cyclic-nucleotide 2'-phosphodiesterase (5'-nucleotidase family)